MIANIINGVTIRLAAFVSLLMTPIVLVRTPRETWDYVKEMSHSVWDGKVR